MMRALLWSFRIFIFLFLLAFSFKNTDLVSLRFFSDTAYETPLVLVALVFFAAGSLLAMLAMFGTILELRREVAELRKSRTPLSSNDTSPPA